MEAKLWSCEKCRSSSGRRACQSHRCRVLVACWEVRDSSSSRELGRPGDRGLVAWCGKRWWCAWWLDGGRIAGQERANGTLGSCRCRCRSAAAATATRGLDGPWMRERRMLRCARSRRRSCVVRSASSDRGDDQGGVRGHRVQYAKARRGMVSGTGTGERLPRPSSS